ncbi:MAG TPA: hypothetical protein HA221_01090 [Halobacteria archaeon]|nr:hypothetical protein [Halobacteria archaeon]
MEQQTPETVLIEAKVADQKNMITLIGKDNRLAAGLWVGFVKGLSIGLFTGFILFGIKLLMG